MGIAGRPPKMLLEDHIRQAMKNTRSNRAAARYLNVSYLTYKMYASMYIDSETGLTLYEKHKNQRGVGVLKFQNKATKEPRLEDLLKRGLNIESYSAEKLKRRLLYENLLKNECYKCGFHEERVLDRKIPLLLTFKDSNRSNWDISNLELLCYNCYFMYVGDVFNSKQIKYIEDAGSSIVKTYEASWELDEYFTEHFQELGLIPKVKPIGEEFIKYM